MQPRRPKQVVFDTCISSTTSSQERAAAPDIFVRQDSQQPSAFQKKNIAQFSVMLPSVHESARPVQHMSHLRKAVGWPLASW